MDKIEYMLHTKKIIFSKWIKDAQWLEAENKTVTRLLIASPKEYKADKCTDETGNQFCEFVEKFNSFEAEFLSLTRYDGTRFYLGKSCVIEAEDFQMVRLRLQVTKGLFPGKIHEKIFIVDLDAEIQLK